MLGHIFHIRKSFCLTEEIASLHIPGSYLVSWCFFRSLISPGYRLSSWKHTTHDMYKVEISQVVECPGLSHGCDPRILPKSFYFPKIGNNPIFSLGIFSRFMLEGGLDITSLEVPTCRFHVAEGSVHTYWGRRSCSPMWSRDAFVEDTVKCYILMNPILALIIIFLVYH